MNGALICKVIPFEDLTHKTRHQSLPQTPVPRPSIRSLTHSLTDGLGLEIFTGRSVIHKARLIRCISSKHSVHSGSSSVENLRLPTPHYRRFAFKSRCSQSRRCRKLVHKLMSILRVHSREMAGRIVGGFMGLDCYMPLRNAVACFNTHFGRHKYQST